MLHKPNPLAHKAVMDLQASIKAEVVGLNELQVAIVTMPHVSASTDDGTVTDVVVAKEAGQSLVEGLSAIENGLTNFMETISTGLVGVAKEFRLPSRVEVKAEESRRASEAWGVFRDIYRNVTRSLLVAVKNYEKGSHADAPATIAWEKEDAEGVHKQIQTTAKALLLAGIFVKQLYGKALMKAQVEFGHRAYLAAFNDLQNFKLSQYLKAAARRARHSSIDTDKYQDLLQEEQERYLSVVGKWDRECEKRESRRGTGEKVLQEQMMLVDRALGLSHLEAVLPQISSVAGELTQDLLSFIPAAKAVEDTLPEHSHEAEEKADALDDELIKMREHIGVCTSMDREEETGVTAPISQSVPHMGKDWLEAEEEEYGQLDNHSSQVEELVPGSHLPGMKEEAAEVVKNEEDGEADETLAVDGSVEDCSDVDKNVLSDAEGVELGRGKRRKFPRHTYTF